MPAGNARSPWAQPPHSKREVSTPAWQGRSERWYGGYPASRRSDADGKNGGSGQFADVKYTEAEARDTLAALVGQWQDGEQNRPLSMYEVTDCVPGTSLSVNTTRADGRKLFTEGLIKLRGGRDSFRIAWGDSFVLATDPAEPGGLLDVAEWRSCHGRRPFNWVRARPKVKASSEDALPNFGTSSSSREEEKLKLASGSTHGNGKELPEPAAAETAPKAKAKSWAAIVRGAPLRQPAPALSSGPCSVPSSPPEPVAGSAVEPGGGLQLPGLPHEVPAPSQVSTIEETPPRLEKLQRPDDDSIGGVSHAATPSVSSSASPLQASKLDSFSVSPEPTAPTAHTVSAVSRDNGAMAALPSGSKTSQLSVPNGVNGFSAGGVLACSGPALCGGCMAPCRAACGSACNGCGCCLGPGSVIPMQASVAMPNSCGGFCGAPGVVPMLSQNQLHGLAVAPAMPTMWNQSVQVMTVMGAYPGYPAMMQVPMAPMPAPASAPVEFDELRNQMEFYFSEDNLSKDYYLRQHMDGEGYVPLILLAGFPRIQKLTPLNTVNIIELLGQAVATSELLEANGTMTKVRRSRGAWRKFLS